MLLKRETKKKSEDKEKREREQGRSLITSMQATADVTKKESSWSSWKGQGTDVFTYQLCFVVVRAKLVPVHVGKTSMRLKMRRLVERVYVVCFACVHLSFH